MLQPRAEAACRPNSLFPGNLSLFLLGPSTDWVKPTHTMKEDLHYYKSVVLNVNLI